MPHEEQLIKTHEQIFQEMKSSIADLQESMGKGRERMVVVEQSTKSAHHRLDSMKEQTNAIIRMSTSVEYMAKQVEDMLGILKEHDGRLDKLEKSPGDTMIAYWKLFIGALVTGGAGVLIGLIMKGGI